VVLAPANEQRLAQLVSEVSSPSSSLYHHYLTERQFVARFGPPTATVDEAESWLRADGFRVSRPSPFVLSAVGSTSAVSRHLGVKFGRYTAAGSAGVVATGAPLLPAGLAEGSGERHMGAQHPRSSAGL
jgi:subtilase family serine protease